MPPQCPNIPETRTNVQIYMHPSDSDDKFHLSKSSVALPCRSRVTGWATAKSQSLAAHSDSLSQGTLARRLTLICQ